jgi:hypothetical protein
MKWIEHPLPERRKRVSRFQNSLADQMYKKARTSESSLILEEQDSESEARPEIYDRVDHVLNGLRNLLPQSMSRSSQYSILTEIMRGMQRDISLVPEEQVQEFMRSIGEACTWIADGSMSDLEEPENAGIRGDNPEEG